MINICEGMRSKIFNKVLDISKVIVSFSTNDHIHHGAEISVI